MTLLTAKQIFRWPPMETAVLRPQKWAHPGVREKHQTENIPRNIYGLLMSCPSGHSERIFRFDRDACSQLESGKMYA